MKKENKNNYYNDEDKINFEKLNNFKKFKSDNVKNFQIKKIGKVPKPHVERH